MSYPVSICNDILHIWLSVNQSCTSMGQSPKNSNSYLVPLTYVDTTDQRTH